MHLMVIGCGVVGLVMGTGLSKLGHHVCCLDINQENIKKLQQGICSVYEPDLTSSVRQEIDAKRLSFTSDMQEAMRDSQAVFICVGTPPDAQGQADLSQVHAVVEQLAAHIRSYVLIISKSTVPVGTAADIYKRLSLRISPDLFDVVSNPEFLREGNAIYDFLYPDRIVIGSKSDKAVALMREIYAGITAPYICTTLESSELIKYASNFFLATKLSFINQIADLCEKCSGNIEDIARGVGSDKRIGESFLAAGPGYGGMCFPKDILALVQMARNAGTSIELAEAVIDINAKRKQAMAKKVLELLGTKPEGKKVAVFGTSFKANTSDMRDAQSIDIIRELLRNKTSVTVCDPMALQEVSSIFKDAVTYADNPYEAASGSDVAVLITDWEDYRKLDIIRLKQCMKYAKFVDLRNCYVPADMKAAGFQYVSIGREAVL